MKRLAFTVLLSCLCSPVHSWAVTASEMVAAINGAAAQNIRKEYNIRYAEVADLDLGQRDKPKAKIAHIVVHDEAEMEKTAKDICERYPYLNDVWVYTLKEYVKSNGNLQMATFEESEVCPR